MDAREDSSTGTPETGAQGQGPGLGEWLTTEQLAGTLGLDPSTLRRWRTGRPPQGPPFVRMTGRVTLYRAADVQAWILAHRIDPGAAA